MTWVEAKRHVFGAYTSLPHTFTPKSPSSPATHATAMYTFDDRERANSEKALNQSPGRCYLRPSLSCAGGAACMASPAANSVSVT
ncbi:hypothetical protein BaRGS_00014995 [Batillaria attramentaria]|uniref:Uncharacterized protein n=1 Tax=Batillaria attramentaria TaxID=370345 RepID=A0ABD0L3Z8_9CAEN